MYHPRRPSTSRVCCDHCRKFHPRPLMSSQGIQVNTNVRFLSPCIVPSTDLCSKGTKSYYEYICMDYPPIEYPPFEFELTDITVVVGSENDKCRARNSTELAKKVWHMSQPPQKISSKRPIVTARQLEIIRGQLNGDLPRKYVNVDKEYADVCENISKYVSNIKKSKSLEKKGITS